MVENVHGLFGSNLSDEENEKSQNGSPRKPKNNEIREESTPSEQKHSHENGEENSEDGLFSRMMAELKEYQPVLVLIGVSFLGAIALTWRTPQPELVFMPLFMGLALTLFAMLKLFDIQGFKQGFAEYDLITARWSQYGYWYPAFELFLGLAFLTGYLIPVFAFLTLVMMAVTAVGVFLAIVNKKDLKCACTGSKINIPLGSVSLIESLGMSVMALALFARTI